MLKRIQRRQVIEQQQRIVDKLHLIEIVTMPFRDPKRGRSRLPSELQAQLRRLDQILHPDRGKRLDREGLARLKAYQQSLQALRRG